MSPATFTGLEASLLAWLATYWVHSTLLLSATWFLFARTSLGSLRLREAVWKTALFGGLLTASLQLALGVAPIGGRWTLPLGGPGSTAEETPLAADLPATFPAAHALDLPFDATLTPTFTEVDAPVPQATSVYDATSGTNGTGATSPWIRLTDALRAADLGRLSLLLWASIGGACLLAMALAWRRLSRTLANKRRVTDGPLPGLLGLLRTQGGVRRPVRLYECDDLTSPLAMGWLLPRICVPTRIHELPRDMQESILAHELAHVARFDPLWLILARSLELAFFFQPLNRVARRHIQQGAELLCDDWAVARTRRPIVLARSLAEVAGWLLGGPQGVACAMVSQNATLGDRVKRLLNQRAEEKRSPWTLPLGAGLIGATALLAPGFADQDRRDDVLPPRSIEQVAAPARPILGTDPTPAAAPEEGSLSTSLTDLAADLSAQVTELEGALEALRDAAERRDVTPAQSARVLALTERAEAMRQRERRMLELLSRLQTLSATGDPSGDPPHWSQPELPR